MDSMTPLKKDGILEGICQANTIAVLCNLWGLDSEVLQSSFLSHDVKRSILVRSDMEPVTCSHLENSVCICQMKYAIFCML